MAIVVFGTAGILAILTACAVVLQSNPFVSALALLGHLSCLAALMLLLQADFVAAAQIIVYAGAVMVMFLFVIAYVGPKAELGPGRKSVYQVAGALLAGALMFGNLLAVVFGADFGRTAAVPAGFGSPQSVGQSFITTYLFAFEAVSLLLLVAAVAATVLGAGPRPKRRVLPADRPVVPSKSARAAASAALVQHALDEQAAERREEVGP